MNEETEKLKEDENTENRNINFLIYALIIFIIIFGATFYFLDATDNKYNYKNKETGQKFSFTKDKFNDDLTLHVLTAYSIYQGIGHKYDVSFRNSPEELEGLFVEDDVKNKVLSKKQLYITLDPDLKGKAVVASVELGRIIGTADWGVFKIPTQVGTTEKTDTTYPVITCRDSSARTGVILLRLGNTTSVTSDKECVIVEGTDYDNLIKAADRLAYNLLGVLP